MSNEVVAVTSDTDKHVQDAMAEYFRIGQDNKRLRAENQQISEELAHTRQRLDLLEGTHVDTTKALALARQRSDHFEHDAKCLRAERDHMQRQLVEVTTSLNNIAAIFSDILNKTRIQPFEKVGEEPPETIEEAAAMVSRIGQIYANGKRRVNDG
jgi:chromosome segregation ATPase